MSGMSLLENGCTINEFYGTDLDKLDRGDTLGVMRNSKNEVLIYINGEEQGVAINEAPQTLYAIINLYGKCVQVSTIQSLVVVSFVLLIRKLFTLTNQLNTFRMAKQAL